MSELQTKNLAEAPVLTDAEEGMNVLVENNGEIKKINYTKIGTGESGSSGGALIVNVGENNTLDKTWKEIHDAFVGGGNVILHNNDSWESLAYVLTNLESQEWTVGFQSTTGLSEYWTNSENGYPVASSGGGGDIAL